MSEKEELTAIVAKYEKNLSANTADLYKIKGEIEGIEKSGNEPIAHPDIFLKIFARINVRDERTIAFLKALTSWMERTEAQACENRDLLTKLLGLNPKSTKQEIIEAIDDVAPLIADYRKKKRGT